MTRKCQKPGCKNCSTFTSKHGCACPQIYDDHITVFESREEREAQGRPVDPKWMQEQNVKTILLIQLDGRWNGWSFIRNDRFGRGTRPSLDDESIGNYGQS